MKRLLTLGLALCCCLGLNAQIILKKGDLIKKDTSYQIHFVPDSVYLSRNHSLSADKPGAQQVYDFRWLDSLYQGSKEVVIKDLQKTPFAKDFPLANAMMLTNQYFESRRNTIQLDAGDFPRKNDTFWYAHVDTESSLFERYAKNYLDHEREGPDETYDLNNSYISYRDTSFEHFIDPALTPWKDDYKDAEASRVVFESYHSDSSLQYRVFEFYKTVDDQFIKYGVGAQIDEGLLVAGQPNGNFRYVATTVNPAPVMNYSRLKIGDRRSNFSTWRAQTKAGFTTLRHFDLTIDTFRVVGHGIAYMEQDSFEVLNIRRHVKRYWYDSLVTPFGTRVLLDSSNVFTSELYAKGYGLPVTVIETGPSPYDVFSVKSIVSPSRHPFGPVILDTFWYEYDVLNVADEEVNLVGHSYVIDRTVFDRSDTLGLFDSLNSPYSSPQLYMSTQMGYGFLHEDSARYEFEAIDGDDTSQYMVIHKRTTDVDGYGTLLKGNDSIEVLRVWIRDSMKRRETWYTNSGRLRTSWDVETRYELWFLAKHGGHPLVRFQMSPWDSSSIGRVHYMDTPSPPNALPPVIDQSGFSVFPNPTNSLLNIWLPNNGASYQLSFIDCHGKAVQQRTLYSNTSSLDISSLPTGIYLLRFLNNENGEQHFKKLAIVR